MNRQILRNALHVTRLWCKQLPQISPKKIRRALIFIPTTTYLVVIELLFHSRTRNSLLAVYMNLNANQYSNHSPLQLRLMNKSSCFFQMC